MGRRKVGNTGSSDRDIMKWWLQSRDGVDAAQDRDIARSCASKDGYRSEAEARAYAAMNGMAGVLFSYECTYCERWHLTRRRT